MSKCTKSLRSSAVRKSVRFWPTQLLFNLNFYFLHNAQRTWVGNPALNKSREPLESGHTTNQWSLHHHLPIGTRGKHGILSAGFKLQWTVLILFPWNPKTSSYPGAPTGNTQKYPVQNTYAKKTSDYFTEKQQNDSVRGWSWGLLSEDTVLRG